MLNVVSYETNLPANVADKAAEIAKAVAAYKEHGSERKAAAALGIGKTTLHRLLTLAALDQDAGLANSIASAPIEAPAEAKAEPAPAKAAEPAKAPAEINPTAHTYNSLDDAYAFFNKRLFGGALPRCLITMQRHKGAYGYFAPERFGSRDGATVTDEIALNPAHFAERTMRDILSTLVHEQAHLWQQHFGEPSRGGYHNKEWGAKMKEIGLHPSSTGEPGGKETGQKVSHYILDGGGFDVAFAELEKAGVTELFGERWTENEKAAKAKAKKNASKTKFECPDCGLNAWAKKDAKLMCGECEVQMECEAIDEG